VIFKPLLLVSLKQNLSKRHTSEVMSSYDFSTTVSFLLSFDVSCLPFCSYSGFSVASNGDLSIRPLGGHFRLEVTSPFDSATAISYSFLIRISCLACTTRELYAFFYRWNAAFGRKGAFATGNGAITR
jgi:hypothetical protein